LGAALYWVEGDKIQAVKTITWAWAADTGVAAAGYVTVRAVKGISRIARPAVKASGEVIGATADALPRKLRRSVDDLIDASKSATKEGIYEFTDTAGKKYIGQSGNIPNRLKQHVKSGKIEAGTSVKTTYVAGGKTAREIAEHNRIQEITGGVPARRSNLVSNQVDPIGPNRRHLLDE
jgi:hypothetical protein